MHFAKNILIAADRRLRKMRAGSVLIIVIVLLLLLAILGAAYISTTRSARVASAQNTLNSDVDTMVNGVAKICEGVITDDLNDTFPLVDSSGNVDSTGNLRGNTAFAANAAPNTVIVNRNFFQAQLNANPSISPNAPMVVGPPAGYTFNPGDLVTQSTNPFIFYSDQGTPQTYSGTPIVPTTGLSGWELLNGHLPITATGSDPWLADRIPTQDSKGNPIWQFISQSIQISAANPGGTAMSVLGTSFVDPRTNAAISLGQPLAGFPAAPNPSYVTQNGVNLPALTFGTAAPYAAADADGDGVADSLFFNLPGPSYDGLTWYAAVRIIDNNSAINANTAWSQNSANLPFNTAAGGGDVWNFFQTNIGLNEILNPADSINSVNGYRFNGTAPAASGASAYDESGINASSPSSGLLRTDYNFISQTEALYQQFIRRLSNPGLVAAGKRYQALPISDQAALAYHFCLVNPESTLNQTAGSILEGLLPRSLWQPTATTYYRSTPYGSATTDATLWYGDNFNYTAGGGTYGFQNLRPLLVTRNPVSNYIQQVYDNNGGTPSTSETILPNYMLPYGPDNLSGAPNPAHFRGNYSEDNTTQYNVNDIVVFPGRVEWPPTAPTGIYTGPNYTFIAVAPSAGGGQLPATINTNSIITAVKTAYWKLQPWYTNPVKANINTAAFAELFRAYWSVMAGNPSNATPFGTTGVDNYAIYDPTAPTATVTTGNPQAMFRSPLRDPTAAVGTANVSLLDQPAATGMVTNTNVMLLRAALAAVNTLGLRDNSQNVTSRTIILSKASQINPGTGTAVPGTVELEVFGNAPQPVISEVYANTYTGADSGTSTANIQGYVAVELYNPYSVPLTLTNWQIGLINRSTTGSTYPYLNFQTYPAVAAGTPPPAPAAGAVSVIGPMQALNNPLPDYGTTAAPNNPPKYDYPAPPLGTNIIYIPAHGYALLENYNGSAAGTPKTTDDATCRPVSALTPPPPAVPTGPGSFYLTATHAAVQTGIWYGPGGIAAPTVCDVYVPNLQLVIKGTQGVTTAGASITTNSPGGELVLLRPRRIDGTYTQSTATTDPNNTFNEGTTDAMLNVTAVNLWDLVPVDSYDFSGLLEPGVGATLYPVWSYVREKGAVAATYFKQFFPGYYDATKTPREGAGTGTDAEQISAATQTVTWKTTTASASSTATNAAPSFGVDATIASYNNPFPPVQVCNVAAGNTAGDQMHFPSSVVSALSPYPNGIAPGTPYTFPLGGFARNGDMLDIPYIGAYRIRINSAGSLTSQVNTSNFLELNSLPKDCALAAIETGIADEDSAENLGRFVPMAASYQYVDAVQTGKYPDGTAVAFPLPDYYAWTRSLLNYLTVQSSTDAYLPNFDPGTTSNNYATPPATTFAYPPQNSAATPLPPTPTLTGNATASDQTLQDNVGVEGLININTASAKVLSTLPFVPSTTAGYAATNLQIAQNIVNYRLTYGPFTSIYDLNQVPGFQSGTNVSWTPPAALPAPTVPTAPTSATGLMSPADLNFGTAAPSTTPTGITEDYQWDSLTLNRISNLITTRSDTFTVYVEVQGWQNSYPGSTTALPIITRRYAYIVDRSAVNADPTTRYLKTVTVPND